MSKQDEYLQSLADRLVEQIENNKAPWQRPFDAGHFPDMMPVNVNGTAYKGTNMLNLMLEADRKNYSDNRWLTFNAAKELGAKVNKGEKGTDIFFYKFPDEPTQKAKDADGNFILDKDGKPLEEPSRPVIVWSKVFNAEQIDGLPPREQTNTTRALEEWERHEAAERILKASGVEIIHRGGERAYYSPHQDKIVLPERSQFKSNDAYYATALHELGHATGHSSRLNRDLGGAFGSERYAKEELRAEIASMTLGQELQIGHDPSQHIAYLQSWAKVVKDTPKEVFKAVKDADAIHKYVLSLDVERTKNKVEEKEQNPLQVSISHDNTDIILAKRGEDQDWDKQYFDDVSVDDIDIKIQVDDKHIDVNFEPIFKGTHQNENGEVAPEYHYKINAEYDDTFEHNIGTNNAAFKEIGLNPNIDFEKHYTKDEILKICQSMTDKSIFQDTSVIKEHEQNHKNAPEKPLDPVTTKTFINVPYAEKNEAKELGAKWDKDNKSWYIPTGADQAKFEKWLKPTEKEPTLDPKQAIEKVAKEYGFNEDSLNNKLVHGDFFIEHHAKASSFNQTTVLNDVPYTNRLTMISHNEPNLEDLKKAIETHTGLTVKDDKTYLYTIPSDKDEVKALGAKYDKDSQVWYIPTGEDRAKFSKWLDRPDIPSPEQDFANFLRDKGIIVTAEHPKADGRTHRLANEGSDQKNVMYQLYPNHGGVPSGRVTNFSKDGEPEKWVYPMEHIQRQQNIDAVDRAKYGADYKPEPKLVQPSQEQNHTSIQAQDEDREQIYNKTAERVQELFKIAPVATQHDYLDKKGVGANGVAHIVPDPKMLPPELANDIAIANDWRQAKYLRENNPENKMIVQKDSLIIPQYNKDGELRSFETIGYNGAKYALKDGEKNGLSLQLGNVENGKPFIVAEGYATGATLKEQAKIPVIVTFGKGNLVDVATDLRERYPDSKIYFAADNDYKNELQGKGNGGVENATRAADAINGHVLIPQFAQGDTGKDWNDVFIDKGLSEFRNQLKMQLEKINGVTVGKDAPKIDDRSLIDLSVLSHEQQKPIQKFIDVLEVRFKDNPTQLQQSMQQLQAKIPDIAAGKIDLPEISKNENKEMSR